MNIFKGKGYWGDEMVSIEKTKGSYRVRLHSPSKYIRFRTKELGKGIKGVFGVRSEKGKRGGRTELQSIIIPKELDGARAMKYKRMYE